MSAPHEVAMWHRRLNRFLRYRHAADRVPGPYWNRLPNLARRSHWVAAVRSLESSDAEGCS